VSALAVVPCTPITVRCMSMVGVCLEHSLSVRVPFTHSHRLLFMVFEMPASCPQSPVGPQHCVSVVSSLSPLPSACANVWSQHGAHSGSASSSDRVFPSSQVCSQSPVSNLLTRCLSVTGKHALLSSLQCLGLLVRGEGS
jgi:hypothetical protein